jgi:hypothetical protein
MLIRLVFTHFGKEVPYSKNWLFRSETLWKDRWDQILKLGSERNLDFVEIVTWNDYGGKHHSGRLLVSYSPNTPPVRSKLTPLRVP